MAILANDSIGDDIILLGQYERDLLRAITHEIIPRAMPEHRDLVAIDIGANIGNHSLAFSRCFSKVLAFEPNPVAIHLLSANVILNRIHNVTICPVGLGEENRSIAFRMVPGNLGASHFIRNDDGLCDDALRLEIVRGDSYVATRLSASDRVGLVKIDVEGFEDSVVDGLSDTLSRDQPLVLFEALNGHAAERTASALRIRGYKHFLSIEPQPVPHRPELLRTALRFLIGPDLHLRRIQSFKDRSYELILACVCEKWFNDFDGALPRASRASNPS